MLRLWSKHVALIIVVRDWEMFERSQSLVFDTNWICVIVERFEMLWRIDWDLLVDDEINDEWDMKFGISQEQLPKK